MKKRLVVLLALALALALSAVSLAEVVESAPVDAAVEEIEAELLDGGVPEDGGDMAVEAAELIDPDMIEADIAPDFEPEVAAAEPADLMPAEINPYTDAMPAQEITLSKSVTRTVYLGVPYTIVLSKGAIKSVKSSAKSVATAKKSGVITLKKTGKAKLTVKGKKKSYTLTLKVKAAPAPQAPVIERTAAGYALNWGAAPVATGYLVQFSPDNVNWRDLVSTVDLTADISASVAAPSYFRVFAVLGDHLGGVSETTSAFSPVTDLKVICEEEHYNGPTNRLNITWMASTGVTGYEVYRAELPSGEYQLIGTTQNNWYPDTRDPKKLYAYRVKGICEGVDIPMSEPVTMWTGYESNVLPPSSMTSSTGIILVVNKKAQVVTAYIKDADGNYTLPIRHMICSTGRTYERTRNGTYELQARHGEWYTYPGPSGDTIRWPSIYRGGYYFHSPLYNRDHTIRGYTVNQLGGRASAGCVRLKVRDAEWVYKNCPTGTKVYICDGKAIKALTNALKPKDVSVQGF